MSSGEGAFEIEGLCRWVYETCGFDPQDPPLAPDLVEALLGPGAIWPMTPSRLPVPARLTTWPVWHWPGAAGPRTREWYVQVRKRLADAAYVWGLAHEVAEWLLKTIEHYRGPDIERQANTLAAMLLVPRAYVLAHGARCFDADLAQTFSVTRSCLALRWAEVTGESLAVVSPNGVHRRGPENVWPEDDTALRWLARYDDAAATSGVRRVRRVDLGEKRTAILLA